MLRKESFNKKQVDKYSSKNQTAVANSSEWSGHLRLRIVDLSFKGTEDYYNLFTERSCNNEMYINKRYKKDTPTFQFTFLMKSLYWINVKNVCTCYKIFVCFCCRKDKTNIRTSVLKIHVSDNCLEICDWFSLVTAYIR
jgi:hypothetical protein